MNEDERGITPPEVTAMTLQRSRAGILEVVIEQGNGDVIKTIELTEMERVQLGLMLDSGPLPPPRHVSFVDVDRGRTGAVSDRQDQMTAQPGEDSSVAAIPRTAADPLLIAWRADATISCSRCGTLAEGMTGRQASPLLLRHYVFHGFRPAALAEEGIEAVPWPELTAATGKG